MYLFFFVFEIKKKKSKENLLYVKFSFRWTLFHHPSLLFPEKESVVCLGGRGMVVRSIVFIITLNHYY
jgi:hypothetical protein